MERILDGWRDGKIVVVICVCFRHVVSDGYPLGLRRHVKFQKEIQVYN